MFLTYLLDRCCEICIVQTVNFPQEPLFTHTRTPFSVRVNAIKSNLMHANAHIHTHRQSQAEKLLNVTPQLPPKKNIAYFGAETKTKKCGRKWRRLLGALRPRTRRAREMAGRE